MTPPAVEVVAALGVVLGVVFVDGKVNVGRDRVNSVDDVFVWLCEVTGVPPVLLVLLVLLKLLVVVVVGEITVVAVAGLNDTVDPPAISTAPLVEVVD